jgi:hypothetical protein
MTLQQPKLAQLNKKLCEVVYSSVYWREIHDWDFDNWKIYIFLWWKQDDKQVQILWGLAAKFKKNLKLRDIQKEYSNY